MHITDEMVAGHRTHSSANLGHELIQIGAKSLAVATGGFNQAQLEAHEPTWLVDNLARVEAAEICGSVR